MSRLSRAALLLKDAFRVIVDGHSHAEMLFDMQKAKIRELQTKLDGHSEYEQMLVSACSPEEARSRIDYAKSRLAAAGIGLPKFQVNRLEVIDHGRSQILPGRQYASIRDVKFEVTMAVQDDGRTLKVFLSDLPESERHS